MSGLTGVRAKVGRAQELLDAIDDEISTWFNGYREPIRMERDDQMNVDRFIWNIPDPPPGRISLLVGDAIHNLRASLDHLVWELSTTHGRTIPRGRQKDVKFPILSDPDRWNGVSKRSLKYLNSGAKTIIEELQPYNGGNPFLLPYGLPKAFDLADYDPLLVLHDWDIIDKHRTLHTVGVQMRGGFLGGNVRGRLEMLYPQTVEYGTEIAWINYGWGNKPPPKSKVQMYIHLPPDVRVLEEPGTWGIRSSVGNMTTFIDSLVPLFDPFV